MAWINEMASSFSSMFVFNEEDLMDKETFSSLCVILSEEEALMEEEASSSRALGPEHYRVR